MSYKDEDNVIRGILAGLLFSAFTWIAIFYILFSTGVCRAQQTEPARSGRAVGQDYLGASQGNFDASEPGRYLPKGTPLGFLDFTFDGNPGHFERIIRDVQPSLVRVHIFNGSAIRGGNAGPYDPAHGMSIQSFDRASQNRDPKLVGWYKSRIAIWKTLSGKYPSTKFVVSPVLEHNLSAAGWRVWADITLHDWPEVQLDNNPMLPTGERYRGAWIEGHGQNPRGDADITSLDGDEATDIDVEGWLARTRHNRITFVWSRSYNCRNLGPWQDPRKRTSCPKSYQFEELAHIGDMRPAAPKVFPKAIVFTSPNIWKPLAEDKGVADPRANLPVLILDTKNKDTVNVVGAKGGVVGTLGYFGPYLNGSLRFYSGGNGGSRLNGYAFEKAANASQGSPWVWLKQDGNIWGPFIPGRRAGDFR